MNPSLHYRCVHTSRLAKLKRKTFSVRPNELLLRRLVFWSCNEFWPQGTALLFFLLGVQGCIAWLTPEQYAQEYVNGVDRLVSLFFSIPIQRRDGATGLNSLLVAKQNVNWMKKILRGTSQW